MGRRADGPTLFAHAQEGDLPEPVRAGGGPGGHRLDALVVAHDGRAQLVGELRAQHQVFSIANH